MSAPKSTAQVASGRLHSTSIPWRNGNFSARTTLESRTLRASGTVRLYTSKVQSWVEEKILRKNSGVEGDWPQKKFSKGHHLRACYSCSESLFKETDSLVDGCRTSDVARQYSLPLPLCSVHSEETRRKSPLASAFVPCDMRKFTSYMSCQQAVVFTVTTPKRCWNRDLLRHWSNTILVTMILVHACKLPGTSADSVLAHFQLDSRNGSERKFPRSSKVVVLKILAEISHCAPKNPVREYESQIKNYTWSDNHSKCAVFCLLLGNRKTEDHRMR